MKKLVLLSLLAIGIIVTNSSVTVSEEIPTPFGLPYVHM